MDVRATLALGLSFGSLGLGCAGQHVSKAPTPEANFAIVEIRPRPQQTLRDEIVQEVSVAESHGLAPFLELTSDLSRRCFLVDHSFDDPGMRRALAGTYIIRVDIGRWVGRFGDTGLDRIPMALPGFVELFEGGRGVGPYIDARSWVADAPSAVAPSLGAFVHSFVE
ncbi:MAG TPA: hypothetical protein VFA43_00990 [Gemmatimonadaceae bacterium]|nr:hypothetical protein [Gemmatimonadaceae bacterium]